MSIYHYSGTDAAGQPCQGEVNAVNQAHAMEKLKEQNIQPDSLTLVLASKIADWRGPLNVGHTSSPVPANGWMLMFVGLIIELAAMLWVVFVREPFGGIILSTIGGIFLLGGVIRWAVKGAVHDLEQHLQDQQYLLRKIYDLEKSTR